MNKFFGQPILNMEVFMYCNHRKRFFITVLIILIFSIATLNAQSVNGYVQYQDYNSSGQLVWLPLKNANIRIEAYEPVTSYNITTDNNGYYTQSLGVDRGQVVTRVYFQNSKINVMSYRTTRSTFKSIVDIGKVGPFPPCPPNIPCDFELGQSYRIDLNFEIAEDQSKFSRVFRLGNDAANFSVQNGFTPSTCNIKYPAEDCIVESVPIHVDLSFFWPNETIATKDFASILWPFPWITDYLGFASEMTENTIYLKSTQVDETVYHEYGHFLMRDRRGGTWPVGLDEYVLGMPMRHAPYTETQQDVRLAYLEGWAQLYEKAVSAWIVNPASPYSISKYPTGHVTPDGYKHEFTVANAFIDFYDLAW